jgi:peptidoglycan/xylan/chitin deacetylase (PgdA/CDA1 family)
LIDHLNVPMKALFLIFSLLLITNEIIPAQTNPSYRITNWMDNKNAAVCVTLDDGCDGQFKYALPAMNALSIRGTFFIISGNGYACSYNNWSLIKSAVNAGHEIGAHTVHHPHLTTLDSTQIEYELEVSDDSLLKILGRKPQIMAYPFGDGAGSGSQDKLVQRIAAKYYIGSRSAGSPPSGFAGYYDYNNPFYPDFYYQVASFHMDSTITIAKFTNVLDNAINAGGWFIPMYHSIETGTNMTVSAGMFTKQIDSIQSRLSKIWIAPFGEQLKYHKEKRCANLSGQAADAQKWILNLSDNLPDSVYYQPLTIRLKKPSWKISSIVQNNVTLSVMDDGDTIQFNAIPDLGNIIIYKASSTGIFNGLSCAGSCVVLDQNYPNPSEEYTVISYSIESPSHVKLEIYNPDNLSVNMIKDEYQKSGNYEIKVNTATMPGGIYLYRLTTDAYTEVKRMVVVK